MGNNHIAVPGFLDDHPSTVKILCPYCCRLHIHGRSPGNRIPHCRERQGLSEYYIIPVNVSLPHEAIEIDRKARRMGKAKPDITALAEEARRVNEQVLQEVKNHG